MQSIAAPFNYPIVRWSPLTAGKPYSLAGDGDKTFVFETRDYDRWTEPTGYSDGPNMIRSEVYGPFFPARTAVQLKYTVTLDPGPITTNCWLILGQIHGDNKTTGSPPLSINIQSDGKGGEEIQVDLNGRRDKEIITTYKVIGRCPFVRGRPTKIGILFIDSRGKDKGVTQVFVDGKLIADYHGPTGYADSGDCYAKFGIYAGGKGPNPQAVPDPGQILRATYINPLFFLT